jgi:hypothetical protein
MPNVSVGLEAIRKAQEICLGSVQDLNGSAARLKHRYQEAGQQWRDNKYTQLGEIIAECSNALHTPVDGLFECTNKLNEIEKVLLEYESVNL